MPSSAHEAVMIKNIRSMQHGVNFRAPMADVPDSIIHKGLDIWVYKGNASTLAKCVTGKMCVRRQTVDHALA